MLPTTLSSSLKNLAVDLQIPDINAQKQICELYQALYDKLESEKYANSLFQKQKQYLLRQLFI